MAASIRNKKHETITRLQARGIWLDEGSIEVDTNGLAWIINYIHDTGCRGVTLTPAMLKALNAWRAVGNIRELRIVVTYLPTWEDGIIYYQITAYLNLTPTDCTVLHFPLTNSIGGTVEINGMMRVFGASPFKVEYHNPFCLRLSDEEAETLRCGGMLRISPAVSEAEIM